MGKVLKKRILTVFVVLALAFSIAPSAKAGFFDDLVDFLDPTQHINDVVDFLDPTQQIGNVLDGRPQDNLPNFNIPGLPNLNLSENTNNNVQTVAVNTQTPAPTVSISAIPTYIGYGEASTITWNSSNATFCNGSGGTNGWAGGKNTSGTFYTGGLTSTTTYSITCSSNSGSVTGSATVIVSGQQVQNPTVSISANPTSIGYGGASTITWNSSNATSCFANNGTNGWSGSKTISGTFYTGSLTNTTTYDITCTNSSGSGNGSITVFVGNNNQNQQTPTISIYASPSFVNYNGASTIYWNSNNATSCSASGGTNGWSGYKNTSGNFYTGNLTYTTSFYITCNNSYGSVSDSVSVSVGNNNNYYNQNYYNNQNNFYQQSFVSISADRTNVGYNESTIIRWYSSNATYCNASGGTNGWAGTKSTFSGSFDTGPLLYSTTYTISCSNYNGGYDTKSVTVTVQNNFVNNVNYTQPTIVLYADQASVPVNGTATIRWITTNATSCFASGGSAGWAGTKSIGPGSFFTGSLTSSRTYLMTCSNSFGSATDSVTIAVRRETVAVSTAPTPAPTSLVLITSSVDRNQPIPPTIDNTRPHPGDEINYTVTYQNIGTGAIKNLTLRLDLPFEVDYLFSNPGNPTRSGNTLTFDLGTLGANSQGAVTIRVRVREDIRAGTNLNFPAILTYIDPANLPQSVTANVTAQVWTEPEPLSPLSENINGNALGANVIGAGFLPGNILSWLLLIVLILLLIILSKHLYHNFHQNKPPEHPLGH